LDSVPRTDFQKGLSGSAVKPLSLGAAMLRIVASDAESEPVRKTVARTLADNHVETLARVIGILSP
jgi:hypothetical protein